MATEAEYHIQREQMIVDQIRARNIDDPQVIHAMQTIPRHNFVPLEYRHLAYRDGPLPIGNNQTISQPYIVAVMTQLLGLKGHEHVLEIGTGCGYQTAVLCEIADYVYSLERYARLASNAATVLGEMGYENLNLHIGDGSQGLPDMAPFDAIIVTAAAPSIPGPLISQLAENGGRLVIPVGNRKGQMLSVVTRRGKRYRVDEKMPVRFVPMLGRYGFTENDGVDDVPDDNQSMV